MASMTHIGQLLVAAAILVCVGCVETPNFDLDVCGERACPSGDMADAVWERDAEVDEMYTALFRELLTYMMEDPRNISPCTHMVFVAKNIERMGDHATNIAETVIYLDTGRRIEAERPKSDTSSFQIISPDGNKEVRP